MACRAGCGRVASYPMSDGPWHIFLIFLRLGCTAFGGPMAHVLLFRQEFVERRGWIESRRFDELFALCQFLPGPSSSQLGMALGLERAGWRGLVAAWLGFTAPSATVLAVLALWMTRLPAQVAEVLHGLKILALAVLLQAAWAMGRSLCPDRPRQTLAVLALLASLTLPTLGGMAAGLLLGAAWGLVGTKGSPMLTDAAPQTMRPWRLVLWGGVGLLALTGGLLVAGGRTGAILIEMLKAGSLVFGGGHVVLPLLQGVVVGDGWMAGDVFLAGYGLVQAMPGPMFSFAAYLGMVHGGVLGALAGVIGLFAPGALALVAALPWWERLGGSARAREVVAGVGAASVGLLLHVLYVPGWSLAVRSGLDFGLLAGACLALTAWRVPPWILAPVLAAGSWALGR